MKQLKIQKIKDSIKKPDRKSKYGFDDMQVNDANFIKMRNGEGKDRRLNTLRVRCSQESKDGKRFVCWADAIGIYYKREA